MAQNVNTETKHKFHVNNWKYKICNSVKKSQTDLFLN